MPNRQRRIDRSRDGFGELAPALYDAVEAFEDELLGEDDDCEDDFDDYEKEHSYERVDHRDANLAYEEPARSPGKGAGKDNGRVSKRRRGPVWDDVDRDLREEEVAVSRALVDLAGKIRPRPGVLVPAFDQFVEEAYATDHTVPRDLRRVPTFPDPSVRDPSWNRRSKSGTGKPGAVKFPVKPLSAADSRDDARVAYEDVSTGGSQEVRVTSEDDVHWFHEHSLMIVSNASLRLRQGADIERFCGACEKRMADEEFPEEVKVWTGSVRPSEVVMRLAEALRTASALPPSQRRNFVAGMEAALDDLQVAQKGLGS